MVVSGHRVTSGSFDLERIGQGSDGLSGRGIGSRHVLNNVRYCSSDWLDARNQLIQYPSPESS